MHEDFGIGEELANRCNQNELERAFIYSAPFFVRITYEGECTLTLWYVAEVENLTTEHCGKRTFGDIAGIETERIDVVKKGVPIVHGYGFVVN